MLSLWTSTRASRRLAAWLTLAAAPLFAASGAQATALNCDAPQDLHLAYEVTTSISQPITDIITFNSYPTCGSIGGWWASQTNGEGTTLITDPFAKSSSNPPAKALMLGLAQDLPNDPEGQMHVVMMADSTSAAGAASIAWGTTFPTTLEANIIANLVLTMRTDRALLADGSAEAIAWDTALDELFAFAMGEAAAMWFDLPANTQPGTTTTSNFSVIAWSDGQLIGNGVAMVTLDPTQVPEPQGLALVAVALLLLASRRAAAGRR